MLHIENITKTFAQDGISNTVLHGVSMDIAEGDFISVVGRSGSGKSTLLNIMSTLLTPDSGEIIYRGADITKASGRQLNQLRHKDFAVIFQFHHLMPYMSALENVMLPFMNTLRPVSTENREYALHCLERVGLADKMDRLPGNLSGGEQQRVAIARGLVKRSSVLFADEPTGSLDRQTGLSIIELLQSLNNEGLTIAMVTHENDFASMAGRKISMEDGRIVQ